MDEKPHGPDMEKIQKLRKEIAEYQSDPFKPFFDITRSERERQAAEDANAIRRNARGSQSESLAGCFLLLSLALLSYGGYRYFNYQKNVKARQATERQNVSNLVAKYNASTDWRKKLELLDEAPITDVQEALITKGNPPL
jgi:hypothetical protein